MAISSTTFQKGHNTSEDVRRKIRATLKSYYKAHPEVKEKNKMFLATLDPHTPEWRKMMSQRMGGYRNPARKPGVGAKISAAITGRKMSEGARRALRKANVGREQSAESRRKKSEAMKGEKNPSWKGGLTSKNSMIRASFEYKLWRTSVFERDNYTCVWCGARNGNGKAVRFNADHIKPFSLFPELRFAIDNGRTLCVDCHKKTDTYAGRIRTYAKTI